MKKAIALFLGAAMAVTMLSACGSSAPSTSQAPVSVSNPTAEVTEETKYKSSITIATTNDLPSNMPYGNSNVQTAMLTNSTFNRLVKVNVENEIEPDLAESWESNEDSTVWTFHLRDDVTFHNGEPFTAEDVKFTFEYAASTENEGVTYPVTGAEYISEIVVEDPYTVTFNLKNSCADWLFYAAQKILSKTTVESEGIEAGGCIGTGPYKFVSHESGVSWTIERYDDYFGEKPVTEQIVFTVITDNSGRALALQSGDVDAAFDIAAADVVKFQDSDKYNLYQGDNLCTVFLGLNSGREACADLSVRQAIAMSINRDDIIAACYEGGTVGAPATNFINNVSPGHADVEALPYDVEGAKALLAEAGYDESNPLELNLYTFAKFIPIAEIVQADLAQAGIVVNIQEWAQSSFSSNIRKDGGYDMYVQQTSSTGGVLNIVNRFMSTGGASNVMNYSNPELDALIDEAAASKNLDELYEKYAEIQQLIAEEVPAVPIAQQYLWCAGTNDFYGVDLGNQNYSVDFSGCYVIEE